MGKVHVTYYKQRNTNTPTIVQDYNISRLKLASCCFRVTESKNKLSQILASIGKSIIVYHLLKNKGGRFVKSDEYDCTDPTEKAVYSYYLGMATCKWVSEELFNIPHLQYLSLARNGAYKNTISGNTCPDLIGKDKNGDIWILEAKGTHGHFNGNQIRAGKNQLNNITVLNKIKAAIVTESYFDHDQYSIYAEDPEINGEDLLNYNDDLVIQQYYKNIIMLLESQNIKNGNELIFEYQTYIDGRKSIVEIGLNEQIFNAYSKQNYEEIRTITDKFEPNTDNDDNKYISSDGISFKIKIV